MTRSQVLDEIRNHARSYLKLPSDLQHDREIARLAVTLDPMLLGLMPDELKDDKQLVLTAVNQHAYVVRYASQRLLADRDVIHTAVRHDGLLLQYAAPGLRKDEAIALTAVHQNGKAIANVFADYQINDQIMRTAAETYGNALRYATQKQCDDKQIVMAAVLNDGTALSYVSDRLRDDMETVLAAVKSNPMALDSASDRLKDDVEVVFAAGADGFEYASDRICGDRHICMEYLQGGGSGHFLSRLSEQLCDDDELVMTALINTEGMVDDEVDGEGFLHDVLHCVSPRLRDKECVASEVLGRDPTCMELLSERLRCQREIILQAVMTAYALDEKYTDDWLYYSDYGGHFDGRMEDFSTIALDVMEMLGESAYHDNELFDRLEAAVGSWCRRYQKSEADQ